MQAFSTSDRSPGSSWRSFPDRSSWFGALTVFRIDPSRLAVERFYAVKRNTRVPRATWFIINHRLRYSRSRCSCSLLLESVALAELRGFYIPRVRGVGCSSQFCRASELPGVSAGKSGVNRAPVFRRVPAYSLSPWRDDLAAGSGRTLDNVFILQKVAPRGFGERALKCLFRVSLRPLRCFVVKQLGDHGDQAWKF